MSSSEDSEKTCKGWGFFQQATQVTGMCFDVDTLFYIIWWEKKSAPILQKFQ